MLRSPRWILLALALPTVAAAQSGAPGLDPRNPISQYLHDVWTIDQGLPQNGILAIAQGRDGYLWLGTEAGLVRFDGVSFTTFTTANTSALKDNYISAVMVDSSDDVLVGGWVGGVSRLEAGAGTSAAIPGAEGSFVNGLYRDRAGRLWVLRNAGLALLRDGAFHPAAGSEGTVFSLAEDPRGLLLAGTKHGLITWQGDRWVPWGRITGTVWTVYHDHTDGWWFGTPDALYYSRGARLERFDSAAGLPPGGVTSILESRNGQLWVGTDGGGLARLVNHRFQRFAVQDGLSDDAVTFLLEDREGSLWVGTRLGGLNRFRQPIFTVYSPMEGLSAKVVWSVYGDRQGALWIGTEAGGLDRLQDGRFTNFMPGKSVVATLQTSDGILWAATRGGLARLRSRGGGGPLGAGDLSRTAPHAECLGAHRRPERCPLARWQRRAVSLERWGAPRLHEAGRPRRRETPHHRRRWGRRLVDRHARPWPAAAPERSLHGVHDKARAFE